MGTIADKLTYLNTTKGKIKDVANMTGAGIDNNTTFRNYAQALYDGYINVLKDRDTLLDNMPKLTSTGSISGAANLPIYEDKMSKLSTQNTTTGKNYLNILNFLNNSSKVYTKNGITATINNNGTITLNGTATANVDFYFNTQTINGENKKIVINNLVGTFNGNTSFYGYDNNFQNGRSASISSSTNSTKDLNAVDYTMFDLYVRSGNTYNNAIFELMVVNTSVSDLTYEEYTGGIASPSPDYPQEVNTVKGYRNLFDIEDGTYTTTSGGATASITFKDGKMTNLTHNFTQNFGIVINLRTPITLTANQSYTRTNNSGRYPYIELRGENVTSIDNMVYNDNGTKTYTPTETKVVSSLFFWIDYRLTYTQINPMMNIGSTIQPYVPYGTNYIYTTISDGTNSRIITIPLNNNEICGIGDYKDELIVDKNGHCWLNKKANKYIFTGQENWVYDTAQNFYMQKNDMKRLSDYSILLSNCFFANATHQNMPNNTISGYYNPSTYPGQNWIYVKASDYTSANDFKVWLQENNVYLIYPLTTENLIDLNYNVDMTLYEGTNNITNSEDMDMSIKYIKDTYE